MEEQVNSLKQSNENLQKHVEDLLNKLKEVRQLEVYVKQRYSCFYKLKNEKCEIEIVGSSPTLSLL